jgi:hypothetical protein
MEVDHGVKLPGRAPLYDWSPRSAARLRAFANASWMLTEPLFTGLIDPKSKLPEAVGWGRLKPGIAGGVGFCSAPGKPGGRPGGGGCCPGGGCCGACVGVAEGRAAVECQWVTLT